MTGKTSRERRYYLSSARLDAATFARAVRGHWGIENRLHWVLDVVFRDDLARLRTGHAPENMAVVRHMAMNLLHQAKPTHLAQEPQEAGRLEHQPISRASSGRLHEHAFIRLPCLRISISRARSPRSRRASTCWSRNRWR